MKKYLTLISLVLSLFWMFCSTSLQGQDTILLMNPSFEDIPRKGTVFGQSIKMWTDCGLELFLEESPPDIHPVVDGGWGVSLPASDGKTYLGLVTRANHSWELVSQQLEIPLHEGKCYSLNAMLALSDTYQSATVATVQKGTNNLESFSHPVMLVIWGGYFECDKLEILAESSDVSNHEWNSYEMILTPHYNCTHITIEAFYSKSKTEHYNGHIMVDNLSPIIEVNCK